MNGRIAFLPPAGAGGRIDPLAAQDLSYVPAPCGSIYFGKDLRFIRRIKAAALGFRSDLRISRFRRSRTAILMCAHDSFPSALLSN